MYIYTVILYLAQVKASQVKSKYVFILGKDYT